MTVCANCNKNEAYGSSGCSDICTNPLLCSDCNLERNGAFYERFSGGYTDDGDDNEDAFFDNYCGDNETMQNSSSSSSSSSTSLPQTSDRIETMSSKPDPCIDLFPRNDNENDNETSSPSASDPTSNSKDLPSMKSNPSIVTGIELPTASSDEELMDLDGSVVPFSDEEVMDLDDSAQPMDSDSLCELIDKCIKGDLQGLGHDASFGSINGEITSSTAKRIVRMAEITEQDVIFDAGCSGGGGLLYMLAYSNARAGIGMELMKLRADMANAHNLSIMKRTNRLPVHFMAGDVASLHTVEGITVFYMWDKCFSPGTYPALALALSNSSTVRCLISAKEKTILEKYNFPIQGDPISIQLNAKGGKCTDTLYVYQIVKCTRPMEERLKDQKFTSSYFLFNDAIDVAVTFSKRQAAAKQAHELWSSGSVNRTTLHLLLQKPAQFQESRYFKKYYPDAVLAEYSEIKAATAKKFVFYRIESNKTQYYRKSLHESFSSEVNAVRTTNQGIGAIIAPSYDKGSNKIVIGMQYCYPAGHPKVNVTLYDITTQKFSETTSCQVIDSCHFDFNDDIPLEPEEYSKVLAAYYRLHPEGTDLPVTSTDLDLPQTLVPTEQDPEDDQDLRISKRPRKTPVRYSGSTTTSLVTDGVLKPPLPTTTNAATATTTITKTKKPRARKSTKTNQVSDCEDIEEVSTIDDQHNAFQSTIPSTASRYIARTTNRPPTQSTMTVSSGQVDVNKILETFTSSQAQIAADNRIAVERIAQTNESILDKALTMIKEKEDKTMAMIKEKEDKTMTMIKEKENQFESRMEDMTKGKDMIHKEAMDIIRKQNEQILVALNNISTSYVMLSKDKDVQFENSFKRSDEAQMRSDEMNKSLIEAQKTIVEAQIEAQKAILEAQKHTFDGMSDSFMTLSKRQDEKASEKALMKSMLKLNAMKADEKAFGLTNSSGMFFKIAPRECSE